MKKITFILLALITTGTAFGQSADAEVSAIIITPLSIAKKSNLVFGTIAPKTTETSVTISPALGANTTTTNATIVGGVASTTPAQFDITADAGTSYLYSIDLTSANNNILKSGTNTMDIVYDLPNNGTKTANGSQSIFVGGTLTIGGSQPAGTYEDLITVTVQYQ